MYTVGFQQLETEIVACMSKGLVALVTSSPGMGKSSLVRKIAKQYRLKLVDIRLSQCTPEDLQGFPMLHGDKARFTPFDHFPLEGEEPPEGYDGWLIFFDELTSATKPVQVAAYKVLLDKEVGSYKLNQKVVMVAAGNKATDKAVVNQLSTALQSRVIHYELSVAYKEFMPIAYKLGFDHRILGFLSYMPARLMDFRPDHQDRTFPCPRTWEFLSKLIEDEPTIDERLAARCAGAIGSGVGTEFITFAKEFDRLPKYASIVADPAGSIVPAEASTKYATTSMLIQNAQFDDLDDVVTYIERFPIDMQIVFTRGLVAKDETVRYKHAGFGVYLQKMGRYLQ